MNEECKPTSEIVAGLREYATFCVAADGADVATADQMQAELLAAADRLEALDRAAKFATTGTLRLPCPTCDGTQRVVFRCVDCSDGLMTHEWAWKIVAAVFEYADDQLPTTADAYRSYLRGIR